MARKTEKPQAHALPSVTATAQLLKQSLDPASGRKLAPVVNLPTAKARRDEQTQNTGLEAGAEAQGHALAQSAINAAKTEGNVWNRFVADLMRLSVEARAEFIKTLRANKAEMQKHVVASDNDPVYKGAKGSANARLSELVSVAIAMNAGWTPETKGTDSQGRPILVDPFYTNVAESKVFRVAVAEGGETASKRGRKRNPFVVQVVKYLQRFEVREGEDAQRKVLLNDIAKQFPKEFKAATAE